MKLHNPNFTALFSTYLHMNMILLITITLLCFQPATFSATSTNETDRLALLKFKRSIVNDPHGILISWNDSIQFCNWHGITCGRRHQRVTTLELQGHDLRGTISAYIGNLTFLRTINLLNNSFYGEIPNEIGHLFRLQDLNLFTNKLGGEIPASLTNCSELRTMDLSWNELVGTIPMGLGSLTKLLSLQVSRNNLTGGIPPSLGNLSLLDTFSVAENLLEGNIPESIGHMKSLSFFTVGDNKLNEYGMGGEASIEGDVYSYGVLVLEMFTRRMPTNDMFKDGLNLHNFVKMALPKRLAQVVDPKLLPKDTVEMGATMTTMMAIEEEEEDKNGNEIELDEVNNIDDSRHIDADIQKCLLSILNIGILCSLESPKERMTMEEVTRELQMIKNTSVGVGINRGRPSKAQAN